MGSMLGTHYFCPPPTRYECAKDEVWGAHRVRVQIPSDLSAYRFRSCHASVVARLPFVELLAHRFNMTSGCPQFLASTANAAPTKRKLLQCPAIDAAIYKSVFTLADAIGVQRTFRSSYAWMGGKGPVGSPAAFPDASDIPTQLKELEAFVMANSGANKDEMAEAIAHQLFMIHPLADGNGRLTRAFLLLYHRQHGSLHALFLFWRLRFGKQWIFDQWRDASSRGILRTTDDQLLGWAASARLVESLLEEMTAQGISPRAIEALALHGQVSLQALSLIEPTLGAGLSNKIVSRWNTYLQGEGTSRLERISVELEKMKGSVSNQGEGSECS